MSNIPDTNDELQAEYQFDYLTGVRGKYYERAMRAKNLVQIDEDLLEVFPNAVELNAALRSLVEASTHMRKSTNA